MTKAAREFARRVAHIRRMPLRQRERTMIRLYQDATKQTGPRGDNARLLVLAVDDVLIRPVS